MTPNIEIQHISIDKQHTYSRVKIVVKICYLIIQWNVGLSVSGASQTVKLILILILSFIYISFLSEEIDKHYRCMTQRWILFSKGEKLLHCETVKRLNRPDY